MEHVPVLLDDVLENISGAPSDIKFMLDGTFGRGGHTRAIMEKFPGLKTIALDRDEDAIKFGLKELSKEVAEKKLFFFHENFSNVDKLTPQFRELMGEELFDVILLDLGVSSPQLDQPERGFSFYHSGPLDMRMNVQDSVPASEIINEWDEDDLIKIFSEYGEVRHPKRAVRSIIEARKEGPIQTTQELSRIIERSEGWSRKGHHPATKYFLALRLVVNKELDEVKEAIPKLMNLLSDGGRLLVISFHSLEDRIVKYIFRDYKDSGFGILINKKVIQAKWSEKSKNPRARSAKLRVFQRGQL